MERFIHVEHGFGPCYAADSTRLFLGTMASPKSREAGFFYMHPRNRFWPIMQALFADPQDASDVVGDTPDSRRAFALRHRFALWDTVESC
ncbi:uracil-DNA glycosylase family protein, partial [Limosilactobacillus reuteri]